MFTNGSGIVVSTNQETNQQPEPQFQPKESTTNQASLREVGKQVASPLQADKPRYPELGLAKTFNYSELSLAWLGLVLIYFRKTC